MSTDVYEPSLVTLGDGTRISIDPVDLSGLTIEHVAWSLARMCRFNGHSEFYSVAQHSVFVASLLALWDLPRHVEFQGLMHDGLESILSDLPRPVKYMPQLAGYRQLESTVEPEFCKAFNVPYPFHPDVKVADDIAVKVEARRLFKVCPEWAKDAPPLEINAPLAPRDAERLFLETYYSIR
jgi:hypothetical protein